MSCPQCGSKENQQYINPPSLPRRIFNFPLMRLLTYIHNHIDKEARGLQWLCSDCGCKYVQCRQKECYKYARIGNQVFYEYGDTFICPHCKKANVVMPD